MKLSESIRLGKIAFANCDFPYYALEAGKIPNTFRITGGHPVELARLILAGELDVSPVSSIMYARNQEGLLVLPRLSITSNDFTKSVLICANGQRELEDLDGRTLCIPEITASSAALIQIILHLRGIKAKIRSCRAAEIPSLLERGVAALLIGDSALHALGKYHVVADLGNEWHKLTGKKMVYALWVVRKDYAQKHPEKVREVLEKLEASRNYAYAHLEEIAEHIAKQKNLDRNFLREYLHTLHYDFDQESRQSLKLYFKYARECGLLESEVEPQFFNPC